MVKPSPNPLILKYYRFTHCIIAPKPYPHRTVASAILTRIWHSTNKEQRVFTENSPILSSISGTPEQVCAYILARQAGEYSEKDIRGVIVPCYFRLCSEVGIDPVLAIAQMIHETGNLTSFWAARPQRNPAGIGVNGKKQPDQPADCTNWSFNTQRTQWEFGVSFGSWENDAIPAHTGRLLAYTLPIGNETQAQAMMIERGLRYRALPKNMRGSAPTLKQLGKAHNPTGQGWASPGDLYGRKIAEVANSILAR